MSEASGVAKISGEAVAGARSAFDQAMAEASGAQLPLLEDEGPDLSASEAHLGLGDAAEIYAIAEERGRGLADAVQEARRRGRKPGAKNRRNGDFSRYLLQFGPHPGVAMMRTMARPVELLAAELSCTIYEAAQLQTRCQAELLPYFEGKKPVEVNLTGSGHMTLVMSGEMPGLVQGGTIGADALPEMSFADVPESVEDQAVSDGDPEVSE